MRQLPAVLGAEVNERELIARASGLSVDDLHPELPPQVISTGLAHLIVSVRDDAVLRAAARDDEACAETVRRSGCEALYLSRSAPTETFGPGCSTRRRVSGKTRRPARQRDRSASTWPRAGWRACRDGASSPRASRSAGRASSTWRFARARSLGSGWAAAFGEWARARVRAVAGVPRQSQAGAHATAGGRTVASAPGCTFATSENDRPGWSAGV